MDLRDCRYAPATTNMTQISQRYLQQVKSNSPHPETLHVVLLFPKGEMGWEHSIPHAPMHRPGPDSHAEEGGEGDADRPCDPDDHTMLTPDDHQAGVLCLPPHAAPLSGQRNTSTACARAELPRTASR